MTIYDTGKHTIYFHCSHIVWITKYPFKVLRGEIRERVRESIRQVYDELGVIIISDVPSSDHVHMFMSVSRKFRSVI